jgi:glycosyltransferase involved in cell wall biosynthesis
MIAPITPVLLTFNEAPNLARTLARLSFASDIVIVDSGSTDETRAIAAAHPGVRVFNRPFTTHAEQWNFGLHDTGITTEWVLALDADFVLSDAAVEELASFEPRPGIDGYWASFDYCIGGRPLRGAAYPPVVVLYRRDQARYRQDGHTQRVQVAGALGQLAGRIRHDDRKPLSQWLAAQSRYMRLEVEKLTATPAGALGAIDRVRRLLVVMPPAMFLYCYLVRGGVLDGWAGLYYALQRSAAELILSLYLVERSLLGGGAPPADGAGGRG